VNAATATRNFKALLKRVGPATGPQVAGAEDPVVVLVLSYLMWESTTPWALEAYRRLQASSTDFNDVRVTMPAEIAEVIGDRSPVADERAHRLRATLRDIYQREHQVSLAHLTKQGKRDIRKYIETLDGVMPYVAARVLLLCFDTHAIPVDEQLRRALIAAEVADAEADLAGVASWLNRQVKANEAVQTHHQLQAWVDAQAAPAAKPKRSPSRRKKAVTGEG
jgi:endonuclease III